MIYGNVNIDMNPDGLGEWDDIPTHIQVPGRYNLDDVQDLLSKEDTGLPKSGIPVTYERDQIQTGNWIKKNYDDCLVIRNSEHPDDYFKFVFTTRTTGNMTTIGIYRSGKSPLIAKKNADNERRQSSNLLLNILSAVSTLDENALDAECDYYSMLSRIIRENFGV